MSRQILFCAAIGLASILLSGHAFSEDAKKLAFFENHVRPLLSEHCFECHNAQKQEGGLRLDHRQAMMAGGDSGATAIAGKPEESLLIEAIRYEGLEMPPDGKLPDQDIAKLVRWVRDGAVWPESSEKATASLGDQDAIQVAADQHWAFQPIKSPAIPETSDPDWASRPIDQFVLAKLEANGLQHSRPAKRMQLVRRAFNDLIGLPPTPEVIESIFGAKNLTGKTYQDIVNGLLQSEHYGERMARHWMDVARYADTRDFLAAADLRYPFAFTYRDWLIHAFNEDLPYDDFVRHQLAADYLADEPNDPNLAALGFLTVGPLFRNNVLERTADRIDVVTRGLMGMTGSCARCHDHKYDPVTIEDYYALYGVFRDSVSPKELPTIENPLGRQVPPALLSDFEKTLEIEKQKLAEFEAGLAKKALKAFQKSPGNYLAGYIEMEVTKKQTIRGLISKRKLLETAMTPIANNLNQFRRDRKNESHPVLGPLVQLIAANEKTFARNQQTYLKKQAMKLHPAIRDAVAKSRSRDDLAKNIGDVIQRSLAEGEPSPDESASEPSLAAIRELVVDPTSGPFVITPSAASRASRILGKGRNALLKFQTAIADVEATHPGAPNKAMALQDEKKLRPVFVMFRGDPSRRGPEVDRRFPQYFAGDHTENRFTRGSGRLELAERIVDRNNPLTARVIVNRVWRMHFGQGLVDDAGDFGLRSEPPAQRELMDYLADSLIQHDWSLKWLHGTIMMSNTYRQASSAMSPPTRDDGTSAAEVDATNQLLWRQNRRRLEFEGMRDAMLAVAGTLDTTIGGRSVSLSENPHPVRRTLYAYVDRVDPDPLFATFDVPSADVSAAQRTETLVPQQALFAMNNPFVTEQARAMIVRSDFQTASNDTDRINVLTNRVLQRNAKPHEVVMLTKFVEHAEQLMSDRQPTWQYGYGPADSEGVFSPLTHFTGKYYSYESERPSKTLGYAMLTNLGGHPGNNSAQSVIRRWTAPKDMTIRITGTLGRKSDRGDGIRALVRINGRGVFEKTLVTGEEKALAGYHSVKSGDFVDFVVDPRKTPTSDSFRWSVLIEERDSKKKKVLDAWYSAREFAGPPPPPMSAWEQAAQALLMTNEFLFVD